VRLFADELARVVNAAKARHVHLSVIISELEEHAAALRRIKAVSYSLK
jgi:hypothetical protein